MTTDNLPSWERLAAVTGVLSLGSGVVGYVIGAVLDTISALLFDASPEWADKLWKLGLIWGAFAAFTYYFLQWSGLA